MVNLRAPRGPISAGGRRWLRVACMVAAAGAAAGAILEALAALQ